MQTSQPGMSSVLTLLILKIFTSLIFEDRFYNSAHRNNYAWGTLSWKQLC
jgi:hypothetical protein